MKKDNRDLSQIYDLYAIRVIVNTVQDCYGVLGIVHSLWKPLPYRFKDYIAMPKPNNYQSLHTTVIGTRGQPVEIQIRTWEMHHIAEYGVAAHWRYKEGHAAGRTSEFDEKMGWLRNLLEWQDTSNPQEFVNALKLDAFRTKCLSSRRAAMSLTCRRGRSPSILPIVFTRMSAIAASAPRLTVKSSPLIMP